jgi:8-oxo-dGTP diphosphatase
MGRRKDCGLLAIPGGYLEKFESWEEGAARELKEEVDITVDPSKIYVVTVYNAVEKSRNYHNVAISMVCKFPEGQEIKNNEPDKCEGWEWVNLNELHDKLDDMFWPNKQLLVDHKSMITYEYLNNLIENPPKHKSCFFV